MSGSNFWNWMLLLKSFHSSSVLVPVYFPWGWSKMVSLKLSWFVVAFLDIFLSGMPNCAGSFHDSSQPRSRSRSKPRLLFNDAFQCGKAMANTAWRPSPDADLTTPEIIRKHDYPLEVHKVTTEDGYILTLFRIPYGKIQIGSRAAQGDRRPAVFVQHGLMASSSDWLMNPHDNSLPYIHANFGYDVWLGNARGTSYSQEHTNLTIDDLAYWKFSWHEMGLYDVPAVIDYILETTNEPKLYYVGHSMGTTMFWVTMSMRPEYNAKIRSMYALSPVAFLGNMLSPLGLLAPFAEQQEALADMIGGGRFLPDNALKAVNVFGPLLCGPSQFAMAICGSFFFSIAGFDPCQFNTTEQISNIVGHTPNTISSRTIVHYLQLKKSKRFRPYDFGPVDNKRVYNKRSSPLDYNLARVTAKVATFWGQNDILSVPEDVERVVRSLPNVIEYKRVDFDLFNHLDFTYGIGARELVYDDVLKLMRENYN